MANVLVLKTVENDKATCDFVVIGISDVKYPTLTDMDSFHGFIKDKLKRDYPNDYDSYGVIYHGNLLKFYDYRSIIDILPKKGLGGVTQYRDYTQTKEAQMSSKSSIVIAEDTATSWNTVRTALGARNPRVDCYGFVLEVIKNK